MAIVGKVKILDNAVTKIYMDAKDKNVSANVIYHKLPVSGANIAFRDHECVVGYDADGLLEAFIKGALVCLIDERGGETLCTPTNAYKNYAGVTTVSYLHDGGFSNLSSIEIEEA